MITNDSLEYLSSWNASLHFCDWYGVSCGKHHRRVTALQLSTSGLEGSLSPHVGNLSFLRELTLSYNVFQGTIPHELGRLSRLRILYLDHNNLTGVIPTNVSGCRSLERINLSDNNFIGVWDLGRWLSSLPNLQSLSLSSTGLSVVFENSSSYDNPEFQELYLASCKLTLFPESLRALKNLTYLDLSNNDIHGRIPDWAGEIGGNGLHHLNLSYNSIIGLPQLQWDGLQSFYLKSNKIQGPFPPSICNMRNLEHLDISNNRFSGEIPQCLENINSLHLDSNQFQGPFPLSICNMRNLSELDISNNSFSGVIPQCLGNISSSLQILNIRSNLFQGPFPPSICKMGNLYSLDLSHNRFSGVIPQCLGNISSSLQILNVGSNQLQGPFLFCNMSYLYYMDISNNRFDGVIPQCLGNISSVLLVLDMGKNHFHGSIPDVYRNCDYLEGLILNGNQLQGKVPSSLSKCRSLKVLDLGNNQLNGTFPGWSKHLPLLQVLILKSNKLHGPIETSSKTKSPFPSMKVLDISHNGFEGLLPGKYFQNFNAMKNVEKKSTTPEYLQMGYEYYSFNTTVKGVELEFPQLFGGYTIVDLSYNSFEGEIPEVIGSITSLIVLDLSHNHLTGRIPYTLGYLSEIESLDLSCNQLTGEIPPSLAEITALGFLNLSQNNLEGRIPQGTQFSTFTASFEGNPKLCGLPLPKKCELPHQPHLEDDGDGDEDEDWENGLTWRVVMMGYGCGTIIGLVMGYFMLTTGRPKWFNAIADAGERMIQTRQNSRRYVFFGE